MINVFIYVEVNLIKLFHSYLNILTRFFDQ